MLKKNEEEIYVNSGKKQIRKSLQKDFKNWQYTHAAFKCKHFKLQGERYDNTHKGESESGFTFVF